MTDILKLLEDNDMLSWEDIQNELKYDDLYMDECMNKLKKQGEIYECKPGKYRLLK
jgi:hypothetical protein